MLFALDVGPGLAIWPRISPPGNWFECTFAYIVPLLSIAIWVAEMGARKFVSVPSWFEFAKTHGAKFPVGWDNGKKLAGQYKPENMPTAYVIDKTGVVRFVHKGYHDGEEKELEKEIKSLL